MVELPRIASTPAAGQRSPRQTGMRVARSPAPAGSSLKPADERVERRHGRERRRQQQTRAALADMRQGRDRRLVSNVDIDV